MTDQTEDTEDTEQDRNRDLIRLLLGAPDEPDEADEQQKLPNYVPREGNNPRPGCNKNEEKLQFVRDMIDSATWT